MYFGTKNILAVLGDPIPGEPEKTPDPDTHNRYACELVKQISDLNQGRYLGLTGDSEAYRGGVKTDFCIGVACYPEAEDSDKELFIMGEKVKAGADFGITQMVFNARTYADYIERLRENDINVPIIPGIRPVTSIDHVETAELTFGANVPGHLKEKLKGASNDSARNICLEFTENLCKELKEAGAPGIHMFTLNDVDMAKEILARLGI
jgi:methylenetetrahydrofolate reductase (NADPH)